MKQKILYFIILIISALLMLSVSANAYDIGDIDGNGKNTAADARMVLRYSAKIEKLNSEQIIAADVDYNESVTAADARIILRVSAKLEKPFNEIDTKNHILLKNRTNGVCVNMIGTIKPVIIFVNDSQYSWKNNDQKSVISDCENIKNEIIKSASSYGKIITITPLYLNSNISCKYGDDGWIDKALASAGLPTGKYVSDALEKKYGVNEAPVVFLFNREGRAHALLSADNEYVVLFKNADGMFHELCHVFGAPDFYYPDNVKKFVKIYFPESIMYGGKIVDDVTAYNLGWTNNLSSTAVEFLKRTAYVTEQQINAALEKQWFSGYVTDYADDNGVYTGYLSDGMYNGKGKLLYYSGAVYDGNWLSGIYHGNGKLTYSDGASYNGNWSSGKFNGYGVFTYADGTRYEGYWVENERQGQGVMTYSNGVSYNGNWLNGKMDGYGVYTYADGAKYEGYWKNDSKHGYGILNYADGSLYDGNWADGKKEGQGTQIYSSGASYNGNWSSDKFNGYGIFTYSDGAKYEGYWNNDSKQGYGVMSYADGSSYDGYWSNDKKEGQGTLYYNSGSRYVGNWSDDKQYGYGIFYFDNGDVFAGEWYSGLQHGYGTYTFLSGSSFSGLWQNGNYIG